MDSSSVYYSYYVSEKNRNEENFRVRIPFVFAFSLSVNIPLTAPFVISSIPFDPLFVSQPSLVCYLRVHVHSAKANLKANIFFDHCCQSM